MANPTNVSASLDTLIAAIQANAPKPAKVGSKKKVSAPATQQANPIANPQGVTAIHSEQAQQAFEDAASSASDLQGAIKRLETGAGTRAEAEAIFAEYQKKIETLKTYDIVRAQNIEGSLTGQAPEVPPKAPQATAPIVATGPVQGPGIGANAPADLAAQKAAVTTATKTTGGGVATGGGAGKPPKQISQSEAYANFRSQYPDEAAIIDSDPSLKALFQQAMGATGGAWSPAKFQQAYESSAYYQTHSDAYRNAEQARLGHGKGSYADAYNNAVDNIKQYAVEAGITIDPKNLGIDPSNLDQSGHIVADPKNPHSWDPQGNNLVDQILHKYWDTGTANKAAIVRYLASKGTIAPDLVGGEAQQNVEQLKSWANDLGLNDYVLSKGANYFNDAASSIAQGKQDINFFHQDLMNQAASRFPIYAKQIAAGLSVRSIAAPYINTMANLLETTPDQIDLSAATGDGATVRKALQGNGVDTPTSLTDFETQVRQDPRWAKTLNAQNTVESTAHKILTDFGVAS